MPLLDSSQQYDGASDGTMAEELQAESQNEVQNVVVLPPLPTGVYQVGGASSSGSATIIARPAINKELFTDVQLRPTPPPNRDKRDVSPNNPYKKARLTLKPMFIGRPFKYPKRD